MSASGAIVAERTRRMRECWQADEPGAFEVAMARRRIEMRRSPRTSGTALTWGLVGFLLGLPLALALFGAQRGGSSQPIAAEPTALAAPPMPVESATAAAPVKAPPPAPPDVPAPRPHAKAPLRVHAPAPGAPPAAALARDTADLARAERWLAVGRGREAEPILMGLEQNGASAEIRGRAAELARQSPARKQP